MNDALIRLVLIVIAAITAVSGLAQLVAPAKVLEVIARDPGALSAHLFATVGMFMVITGGMFLQSLLKRSAEPAIPFWIGVQKAAAAVLVVWAVYRGLFMPLSLGVAAFDAVTGIIAFVFWSRLPR
jgi:hypothetical protein